MSRPARLRSTGMRLALRGWGMLAAGALFVGGCSSQADDPRAVTADEARQLNEAAAMLDNHAAANESPAP